MKRFILIVVKMSSQFVYTLTPEEQQLLRDRPVWSQGHLGLNIVGYPSAYVRMNLGGRDAPYHAGLTCPMSAPAREAIYLCANTTGDPMGCLENAKVMCRR